MVVKLSQVANRVKAHLKHFEEHGDPYLSIFFLFEAPTYLQTYNLTVQLPRIRYLLFLFCEITVGEKYRLIFWLKGMLLGYCKQKQLQQS